MIASTVDVKEARWTRPRNGATLAVILISLYGCATTGVPLQQHRVGYKPQYSDVATTAVGGPVYSEFDYLATDAATLTHGFNWSRWPGQSVLLPPGFGLVGQTADGEARYCTPDARFGDALAGPTHVVCFYDTAQKGSFDEMIVLSPFTWRMGIPPTPYKKGILTDMRGFKRELLYQGREGFQLKLTYREYINSVARPTVSEDTAHEFKPHATLQIHGAKLEVVDADADHLSYRVLEGFK